MITRSKYCQYHGFYNNDICPKCTREIRKAYISPGTLTFLSYLVLYFIITIFWYGFFSAIYDLYKLFSR